MLMCSSTVCVHCSLHDLRFGFNAGSTESIEGKRCLLYH